MSAIVLASDLVILRIPVEECGEPLVNLRNVQALRLDSRLADPAGSYAQLRQGVVDRLVTAQSLLPVGLRFLVIEGYRPLELERLWHEAGRSISPPEVAPHVTGAAIDLTLCTTDGQELWMGGEVNDADSAASYTEYQDISIDALKNRRLLRMALESAGLVNYPPEWWHWSYGDRYWAYSTRASAATYGPVRR